MALPNHTVFKDLTADQVHTALAPLGVTPGIARRLQAAVFRTGALPRSLSGVSPKVMDAVRDAARVPHLALVEKIISPQDGFVRYLFRSDGPETFETVRIPLLHKPDDPKYIVCVSSQVGCALGCAFCATGRMGFRRDLAAWEIVDQAAAVQADSPHPVRCVVFMGMGEPLLNYDIVIRAARILSEPCAMAISGKAITISTAGIVAGIRRFTAEGHPYRLVVSLSFADPAVRRAWMPVEADNPTSELIEALRAYHAATGRRVTLAWTMLAGVNTRAEDARQLAALTRGLPVKLDLIDVNDPTGRCRAPSAFELAAFRDALRAHMAMPVARRYSGGRDIHAACGMLAGGQD